VFNVNTFLTLVDVTFVTCGHFDNSVIYRSQFTEQFTMIKIWSEVLVKENQIFNLSNINHLPSCPGLKYPLSYEWILAGCRAWVL